MNFLKVFSLETRETIIRFYISLILKLNMKLETLLLLHLRYFNYSSLGLGNPQFGTKSLQLCSQVKIAGFNNKRKQELLLVTND